MLSQVQGHGNSIEQMAFVSEIAQFWMSRCEFDYEDFGHPSWNLIAFIKCSVELHRHAPFRCSKKAPFSPPLESGLAISFLQIFSYFLTIILNLNSIFKAYYWAPVHWYISGSAYKTSRKRWCLMSLNKLTVLSICLSGFADIAQLSFGVFGNVCPVSYRRANF